MNVSGHVPLDVAYPPIETIEPFARKLLDERSDLSTAPLCYRTKKRKKKKKNFNFRRKLRERNFFRLLHVVNCPIIIRFFHSFFTLKRKKTLTNRYFCCPIIITDFFTVKTTLGRGILEKRRKYGTSQRGFLTV